MKFATFDPLAIVISESFVSVDAILIGGIHVAASDFRSVQQFSVNVCKIVSIRLLLLFPALLIPILAGRIVCVRSAEHFQHGVGE